jgi:hypothetical protein
MVRPDLNFFEEKLREPYEALLHTQVAREHLTGHFRLDGQDIEPDRILDFDPDEVMGVEQLRGEEIARLLMLFDGSRVREQPQYDFGQDDSPPGVYFTYVNTSVVKEGHKNRVGVYQVGHESSVFLGSGGEMENDAVDGQDPARAVHVDHMFLRDEATQYLATVSFALCAITAHTLGYSRISLIAAGGKGFDRRMVGYNYWPKLGFDGELLEAETAGFPELQHCATVQDILATDPDWWEREGSQRWMEFDLRAGSPCWEKMLNYLGRKGLI